MSQEHQEVLDVFAFRAIPSNLGKKTSSTFLVAIGTGARVLIMFIQMSYGIHSIGILTGAIAWSGFYTLNGAEFHATSHGLLHC